MHKKNVLLGVLAVLVGVAAFFLLFFSKVPIVQGDVSATTIGGSAYSAGGWTKDNVNVKITTPTSPYLAGIYHCTSTSASPASCGLGGIVASSPSPNIATSSVTVTVTCSTGTSCTKYFHFQRQNGGTTLSREVYGPINIDKIAPVLTMPLPAPGVINAGNMSSFTFSGACEAGRTVELIDSPITGTTTCTAGGAWSITKNLSAYADGDYTLQARELDAVGNVSTATLSIKKDTSSLSLSATAMSTITQGSSGTSTITTTSNNVSGISYSTSVVSGTYHIVSYSNPTLTVTTNTSSASGTVRVTATGTKTSGGSINASVDVPVTVVPPAAVVTGFTATPQGCGTGQVSLSWTATGASYYKLYRGATLLTNPSTTSTSYTDSGSAGASVGYDIYAYNSAGTASSPFHRDTAYPPVCQPDLTAGSVSPATATVGVSRSFSATITNNGTGATGGTFSNTFQFDNTPGGSPVMAYISSSSSPLAGNGAQTSTGASYTFSVAPGTYYGRLCAGMSASSDAEPWDWNTPVTESNELNNCGGWTSISVTCPGGTSWNGSSCVAPPSGSITPSATSCNIASGQSTCNITISWSTSDPVGTSQITSSYPSAGTVLFTANSGTSQTVSIPYSSRNIYLYNNSTQLDSETITASCAAGANWTGSICLAPPATPTGFSANPSTCSTGTINLSWNASSGATSYRVYRDTSWEIYNGSGLSTSDTGLAAGSGHTYGIVAANAGGSSSQYNIPANIYAPAVCSPTGSLSLSSNSCTIAMDSSNCTLQATWSTQYATDPQLYNSTRSVLLSSSASGSGLNITITYPQNTIQIRNSSTSLDSEIATATCVSGSAWDGAKCASTAVTGSLTTSASSCQIALNASTCTVLAGWGSANTTFPNLYDSNTGTVLSTAASGSNFQVWVAYPQTIFQLRNGTSANPPIDILASRTVTTSCASGGQWDGTKCAAYGTISASDCIIPSGAAQCSSSATWTLSGLSVGAATSVTRNNPVGTSVFSDASYDGSENLARTNYSHSVGFGSHTFYLYHNGVELASDTMVASCTAGTQWDSSLLVCAPAPTVNISASPASVNYNGTSTITWSSSYATSSRSGTCKSICLA